MVGSSVCREHFHRAIEILVCLEGSKHVILDGNQYILQKGDILFVPPLAVHSYLKDQSSQTLCAVFPLTYSDVLIKQTCNHRFDKTVLRFDDIAYDIINHLKMLNTSNPLIKKGIYNYVLGKFIELLPLSKEEYPKKSDFSLKIIDFLEKHYAEDLKLENVSKQLGYNRCYFSTMFNRNFHSSFSTQLAAVRINKSLPLLEKYSISQAASKVGFKSLQNYYLCFKKIMGQTPKKYIENNGH